MAKYIIIGGVAGGATAAARLRRIDEHSQIIIFEKGAYISYANCGLPYYIGGVIPERRKLFVQNAQAFAQRFNVDVRCEEEVIQIDRERQTILIRRLNQTNYEEQYDKLLISTGAKPIIPPLEGMNLEGVFTLRDVQDTDQIKSFIDNRKPKHALIVGAGFIGLEMAENFCNLGIEVTIVEQSNQVLNAIDYSMASFIHTHLQDQGVQLELNSSLHSIKKDREHLEVSLSDGRIIQTDLVLLSLGVRPNSKLAKDANLQLGVKSGIQVNEYLQTSDPNIYAIGDVIEYPHPITNKPWHNNLAGPANRQARLVADNIVFGEREKYEGSIGTAIAKVFDYSVACTGLSTKSLEKEKLYHKSVTIQPNNHAGYYPNATTLVLKLLFNPKNEQILGAQIIAKEGADKRIDSIAQIIKQRGTIQELMQTEQAYAPPFSSAKDPVALSAYVANNIITGKMKELYWKEMLHASLEKVQIIDVRTPKEFSFGYIQGAVNIPLDELRNRLEEVSTDKKKYVYCAVGMRGYLASNILEANGFEDVYNLVGGYSLYASATRDLKEDAKIVKLPCQIN